MNDEKQDVLAPVWASMLSNSLKQTLVLSYLNKKFPGSIQEMTNEFGILSKMLSITPEVEQDINKTLTSLPVTKAENNPFRIISNEIMSDTLIQTLMLRYFIKLHPDMAKSMLEDFQLILPELDVNDTVKERVSSSLSEFLDK